MIAARTPVKRLSFISFSVLIFGTIFVQSLGQTTDSKKSPISPVDSANEEIEKRLHDLRDFADSRFKAGDYGASLKSNKQILALLEEVYSEERFPNGHLTIVETLLQIAVCHQGMGDYELWNSYCEQSLEMCRKLPESGVNLIEILVELSMVSKSRRDFNKARDYLCEAEELSRTVFTHRHFPDGHPRIGDIQHRIGEVLLAEGKREEAIAHFEKAIAFCRTYCDKHNDTIADERSQLGHLVLSRSLRELGLLREYRGEFSKALSAYEQRESVVERLFVNASFPNGRSVVADNIRLTANVYLRQDNYYDAFQHFLRALQIYEKLENEGQRNPMSIAIVLGSLAATCERMGELEKASDYGLRAIAQTRNLQQSGQLGKGNALLPSTIRKYAILQMQLGNFDLARSQFMEALAILRETPEKSQDSNQIRLIAICLNDVSSTWASQGEFHRAIEYSVQSINRFRAIHPPEEYPIGHPDLAQSLQKLGKLYWHIGDTEKSLETLRLAVSMWDGLDAAADDIVAKRSRALALRELGTIHRVRGNLDNARLLLDRSQQLFESCYPPEKYPRSHVDLAESLRQIAQLHLDLGNTDEAIKCTQKAVHIVNGLYPRELFPIGHMEIVKSLTTHATVLFRIGNYSACFEAALAAAKMQQDIAHNVLPGLSETECFNFVREHLSVPAVLLEAWPQTDRSIDEIYALIWNQRAIVLRTIASRQMAIRHSDSTSIKDCLQQQRRISRQIARAILSSPSTENHEAEAKALNKLTEAKEELERELIQKLPNHESVTNRHSYSHLDLQKLLPTNHAFVEFLWYQNPSNEPSQSRHAAFVLRRDKPVSLVYFGDSELIETEVRRFRQEIIKGEDISATGDKLRKLVWKPIEAFLDEKIEVVYLCPDGVLAAVPWAALPGRRANSVLLQDYSLVEIPSGQYLCDWLTNTSLTSISNATLLAVGDVDFNFRNDNEEQIEISPPETPNQSSFLPLPATKDELEVVVRRVGEKNVKVLRGSRATTQGVIAELPRASWAHFATHGYFAKPEAQTDSAKTPLNRREPQQIFSRRYDFVGRNPLLLSGLVLAGANLRHTDEEKVAFDSDDGILTAEVISRLNLERLQLTVLSACETGLGDLERGEGVLGLQRAFHIAGAKNVIASLWKVDDRATAILMELMYDNLALKNMSARDSLREAQLVFFQRPELLQRREELRGRLDFSKETPISGRNSTISQRHTHARHWAAFVLSGTGQ